MTAPAVDLVTVASYPTAFEAETVRAILEERGVKAVLTDSEIVAVGALGGYAVGNVGLQVLREDAPMAVEILREHATNVESEEKGGPGAPENACISCGAEFPEYLDRCPACGLSYS